MKTVKNYTNSELFTLANKIRRESGCSKSEAYQKAKAQLETPKNVGRKSSGSVVITNKFKPNTLAKFDLVVGTVYPSMKALAVKMNTSYQNVYAYYKLGYVEFV